MAEALRLGLEAEFLVRLERDVIEVEIVVRRDRVEAQVRAELSLVVRRVDLAGLDLSIVADGNGRDGSAA